MIVTMKSIKKRHRGVWFRPAIVATRRIPTYGYATPDGESAYFVTADRLGRSGRHMYTVRVIRSDGTIGTVDGYMSYPTRVAANRRARELAES